MGHGPRNTTRTHTTVVRITFALSLLAATQSVEAQGRTIEFQLSVEKLSELVSNRIMAESETLCAGELNLFGWPVVLDHMEFPAGGALRREAETTPWPPADPNQPLISAGPYDIRRTQLAIPVTFLVKSEECVLDATCGRDEYALPPAALDMIFTLSARGSALCVAYDGLEHNGTPLDLGSTLGTLEAGFCQGLNLGAINQLIGQGSTVTNTGLSTNSTFEYIAFRIELDGQVWDDSIPGFSAPPPDPAWLSFFAGQTGPGLDQLPGRDWSVFVDHALFTSRVVQRFDTSLTNSTKFEVERPPGVTGTWTPQGESGGNVTITFSGEVDINTDFCVLETIGVDPATVAMDYSVHQQTPNILRTHATLETDLVDSDVLVCSGLLGFHPPAILSLGIVASTIQPGEGDLNLPAECTTLSGTEFVCALPMQLPDVSVGNGIGLTGTLTLDKMVGLAAGPVMGGPCAIAPRTLSRMNFASDGFDYGVHGGCYGSPNGTGEWPWIGYRNTSEVSGLGILCQDIEIINDPLGLFAVVGAPRAGERLSDCCPRRASTFGIKFPRYSADPSVVAQYFDPNSEHYRYPCQVLIRSSAGSQTFEIPPPTEGDQQRHLLELMIKQADCIPPAEVPIRGTDIMWQINPAPIDIVFRPVVDDPDDEPVAATGELSDMRMTIHDPIGNSTSGKGNYKFNEVSASAQGTVALDPCLVIPCGDLDDAARGANSTAAVGDARAETDALPIGSPVSDDAETPLPTLDLIEFEFSADVLINLTAVVLDEDLGALVALNDMIRIDVEIPRGRLPAGADPFVIQFDIPPSELTLMGTLPQSTAPINNFPDCPEGGCANEQNHFAEPDNSALEMAPSAGPCGAGLGFFGPMCLATLFVGLCRVRGRRRARRSTPAIRRSMML